MGKAETLPMGSTSKNRYFCRKAPTDFGVNVYRNSTGDLVVGKSPAKADAIARHK
jgi:hypothetical protein